MRLPYWLASISFCLLVNIPAVATPFSENSAFFSDFEAESESQIFPIQLNVARHSTSTDVLVRGEKSEGQAFNLDSWLLPLDAVIEALNLEVTPLENHKWQVRSRSGTVAIDPKTLKNDLQLGKVISVKEVETLLEVPVEFDPNLQAIQFHPDWLQKDAQVEKSSSLLELPYLDAPDFSVTAIRQRTNIVSKRNPWLQKNETSYRGDLTAMGTAFDGSWYVSTNQPDITDYQTWRLKEAQYWYQNESADYVIGSQPQFWFNDEPNDYWGLTLVERSGFTPPPKVEKRGFIPQRRLESDRDGKFIFGEAEPGTLVQLTEQGSDRVLSETLVDSSGEYRFERKSSANNFHLWMYPDGQLEAQPRIKSVNFPTLPGQLPVGASALTVSAGIGREFLPGQNNFFGEFQNLQGGINYRYGISPNLTLGTGIVYQESVKALGELFYAPANSDLQIKVAALSNPEHNSIDLQSQIRLKPGLKLDLDYDSNFDIGELKLNWRLAPGLSLAASGSLDQLTTGVRYSYSSPNFSTSIKADIDSESNLLWRLNSRWDRLRLTSRGNRISSHSEINYNFSGSGNWGHFGQLGYQSRRWQENKDHFTSFGWRYRSRQKSANNQSLWELELGYGSGSQGSGMIASAATAIIPGLALKLGYEDISLTSNDPALKIEFIPNFNQTGFWGGDSRFEHLRQQGGLQITAFFDKNNNGKQDFGEPLYTENSEELLLDGDPLKAYRPKIRDGGILVELMPATYRLEVDTSLLPDGWTTAVPGYEVEVVAGSYTPVTLPLRQSE